TEDTAAILASFIASFGEPAAQKLAYLSTAQARAAYYRSLLAEKRCLVVLDNAETASQVASLLPAAGPSAVLVTTRHALAHAIQADFELSLRGLPRYAAGELLLGLVGDRAPGMEQGDVLASLCDSLENLPLAIRIAAGIIRELGWSLEDYWQRFRQSSTL